MASAFTEAWVRRFEALAQKCDKAEDTQAALFEQVEQVRKEARDAGEPLDAIIRELEAQAHKSEMPHPEAPDVLDQGAPLRRAGLLRRAADLLRGPEKDLTPRGLSGDEAAKPAP